MQLGEVMTLLTSGTGHPLVKSFGGADVIQRPFSTGKLFNVSEEPVPDLQSLSALLQRLENDPTHTVISIAKDAAATTWNIELELISRLSAPLVFAP